MGRKSKQKTKNYFREWCEGGRPPSKEDKQQQLMAQEKLRLDQHKGKEQEFNL